MWTANDSNSIFQRLNCLHFIKKILTISFCCHLSLSHVQSFAIPWTQNTRLICPPLSSGVCSNSCLLSWWCYLTISSSATVFSFCLQYFPVSGSFPVSQLFTSGGQNIRASASAPVLPMNIQGWFPLYWLVWSCYPRNSQESSPAPQFESISSSVLNLLYVPTLTSVHAY